MGSEHKVLLLHSHIRWLSRGRVLKRFFDLRVEIEIFLNDRKSPLAEYFKRNIWLAEVAYLADIFSLVNELTLSMQGPMTNLFMCHSKVEGFLKKLDIWEKRMKKARFDMFQCYYQVVEDKMIREDELSDIIINHLQKLKERFLHYFPPSADIRLGNMWIQNPFLTHENNVLNSSEEEELAELSSDKLLQAQFGSQKDVVKFWKKLDNEYPNLSRKAIQLLLPFPTTYLAETAFSALTSIKNKYRNRLQNIDAALRIALSKSIEARIEKLVNEHQEQKTH